ncbi:hypothetical protein ACFX2J_007446 [Malus domestica]
MTQAVVETIGSLMGEVRSVDKTGSRDCIGRFLRVKIGFNVREPLMRGTFVTFPDDGKIWIDFKYESLPNYCLICGKLGHPTRICKETLDERTDPEDGTKARNEAFAFSGFDAVSDLRGNPLGAGPRNRASFGSNGGQSGSERWNDELGGGRRSGRSSTASGIGCQPQEFASRSQSSSECIAPLEEKVIDTATSPSKPRWSSNKMGHRDNVLAGKIRCQRLVEEEARSTRELAFDAGLIGPGGAVAAEAEHVVLNDHYEQEGRVDTVSMTLNGGSTFDLNLMPGVGEDGDSVSVSRRKTSEDRGCVSGCDLVTDDDPFELEAIIEAVMNENKGKKRSVREVEYDEVNPCVEPKRSKLSRESYVEAKETSREGSPKSK